MRQHLLGKILFAFTTTLVFSSCEDYEAMQKQAQADKLKTAAIAPNPAPSYWDGELYQGGPPKIVIKLREQRGYFFKGARVVGEANISTGRKGFETPPGRYRVIQKDENHVSNLYGDYVDAEGNTVARNVDTSRDPRPAGTEFRGAPMRYFLRFTRGYGMHAGFVPRYRASHGCIRMPAEMAKHFFDAAALETPVIVEE